MCVNNIHQNFTDPRQFSPGRTVAHESLPPVPRTGNKSTQFILHLYPLESNVPYYLPFSFKLSHANFENFTAVHVHLFF